MSDDEPIIAYGRPYHDDDVRIMFCQRGAQWCGWIRTSNSSADHERYTKERDEHHQACNGGLFQ